MTLLEYIDDHLMSSDIMVYSSEGQEVGRIPQGDESALRLVRDYAHGEVLREGAAPDGSRYAYVRARPSLPDRGPVLNGYPGEVEDEAAFSADWRSREPKASPKQTAFLYKNLGEYRAIRKPSWPADPSRLLRYEASDAMTAIFQARDARKAARAAQKGGRHNG